MLQHGTLLTLLVLVATGGCGDTAGTPQHDGGMHNDAGTEHDAGMQHDAGTGGGPMGPGLTGVLADEGGQPIGDVAVLACTSKTCLYGQSDAAGRFAFPFTPPVDVAVKAHEDLTTMPRRAAAIDPVHLADMSLLDIGTLYVPNLPAGVLVGPASSDPQTLMVGDGLQLTLRRADLTLAVGDSLVDVAARAVPAAHQHPLLALGAEKVEAVYALHPFAATSKSPIAIKAPSKLPAGTSVSFRTISELDGHLSAPVHGQADGAFVATDPSVGIDELSWLVISR